MANTTVTKGSAVEVSSDEPGFHGAWYVATFIDEVEASPTKKRPPNNKNRNENKIGYLVKYDTLLNDDDASEPLTEVVDPLFVRPSPPRNIRRNNNDNAMDAEVAVEEEGGDFEVYDVIDAYHRDGWWIGVVKSVIVDGEMRRYVVSFENPHEELEFERSKLRLHVDWVDCRWLVPPKKTPEQELGEINATNDAGPGFTTPSKGARIDNETVGPPLSAKKNIRLRKRSESNSTVDSSVTCGRNKRIINLVEDDSRGKRFKSSADGKGSEGNKKVIVSVMETSVSEDIPQDSPRVEHEIVITRTCESEDGKSHRKRKGGRRPKLVVKKPIGLLQDGHDVTTDIDEQPLSFWYQGTHPLSALKRSSCFGPLDRHGNSSNQAIVTSAGTTTDYQQDWPFIKRSPIWDTIELHLTPPQKPHFSPLRKMNEDYREGLAIAHMVTFGNIVQRLSEFQPNEPVDLINNSLKTLCDLETHGFDVGPIRGRLNKLLSLKSKVRQHEDMRKEVEKELEKCNVEKTVVEKEMEQLKVKMQALNEKMTQITTVQKVKEEQIVRLQSNLQLVSNRIEKLAATPL